MFAATQMGAEIIIVDDDPIAGSLTTEILADAGYRTLLVDQSTKALAAIKQNRPRLAVLDILMPGIDGITLCKMIRDDAETKDTRIIIVSGKSFQAEKDRAIRLGANLFVEKPYNVDTFAQSVQNLIGPPVGGADEAPAPEGPAPAAGAAPPAGGPVMTLKVWGSRSGPVSGASKFGNHTPCATLEAGKDFFILDAGTGIVPLGAELVAQRTHKELWLFLFHFQPLHTEGLLEFAPLFDPEFTIHWGGANDLEMSLENFLQTTLQAAYQKTGKAPQAQMDVYEFIESTYNLNPETKMATIYANHPYTSVGYSFERGGKRVIYMPASELYADPAALQDFNEKFSTFAQGATLLIHDATFNSDDYEAHKNQGHSGFVAAVDCAIRAEVPELVLFNHNASYSDAQIEANLAGAVERVNEQCAVLNVRLAVEGESIEVTPEMGVKEEQPAEEPS